MLCEGKEASRARDGLAEMEALRTASTYDLRACNGIDHNLRPVHLTQKGHDLTHDLAS